MAENPRQEVEIQFNGRTYLARPTFQIITTIEAATNQPARNLGMKALIAGMPLAQRAAGGYIGVQEISMGEISLVLWLMLRDHFQADKSGSAPQSAEGVGEFLMDDGYLDLCGPVGEFLTRAQRGNKEHVRQAEIAAKRAEEAAKRTNGTGEHKPPDGPTQASTAPA